MRRPPTGAHRTGVANPLRGLPDQHPRHIAQIRHQVEILKVAQQAERTAAASREDLGVQPVRRVVCVIRALTRAIS